MAELTDLGKVLHEEHFRILVLVCGLENRITGERGSFPIDPANSEDRALLEELACSLEQVVDHNAFEERVLFPLLSSSGGEDVTSLLKQEHVVIGPMARRVRVLAADILRCGTGAGRADDFHAAAASLVVEMLQHLQKEELSVVQRLDVFLDAATDSRLAREIAVERGLQGHGRRAGSGLAQFKRTPSARSHDHSEPDRADEAPSDKTGTRGLGPRRFSPASIAARTAARRRSTTPPVRFSL